MTEEPAAIDLAEFDKLWDYDKPAETETRFVALLPAAEQSGDRSIHLEILTQIARTQGLQRRFADAHQTLDQVEAQLQEDQARPRIRYLLERGRAFRSAGQAADAEPLFLAAWELAGQAGEDALAVDAAHMLAIVAQSDTDKALAWNLKALNLAEVSAQPRARKWLGSLYNNIGWTYHDMQAYDRALATFQSGLAWHHGGGHEQEARIAKWSVARTLRSLGRTAEALEMQQALEQEFEAAGAPDGFVFEELAECLLLLGQEQDARPYFARAYGALSQDAGLVAAEPGRIQRLKDLGGVNQGAE